MLVDVVVWACWGLLIAVWIGGALYFGRRATRVQKRSFRSAGWYLLVISLWLVTRALLGVDTLSLHGEPESIRLLGTVLLVVSTGFALWARVVLGSMWSSSAVARERHILRIKGPYAVSRHPIYAGILGMLLGTAVALGFGAWLYVFVLALVVFVLRIRAEERLLNEVFPGAYEEYRRRVPALIPSLRRLRPLGS
jgi:protein-S-isoprenylcysteine O-methyltransferase Ste14